MSTPPAVQAAPPPPLKGGQLVLATIVVALATFMNVLDSSIANVAIPTISGNLGVSVDEGTWVITVFAAANAVSIPLTGWLTQRIGQIKLFVDTAHRAGVARGRCRAADSVVAGYFAWVLPEGESLHGARLMGDDRNGRADRRTGVGRLDHRSL
jgi:DHA2 family multidrug resistance protein